MSAELYRMELGRKRQEVLICRMRRAIDELSIIADSAALSSLAYPHIQSRINELRSVGKLTVGDIAEEFRHSHPGRPPDEVDRDLPDDATLASEED